MKAEILLCTCMNPLPVRTSFLPGRPKRIEEKSYARSCVCARAEDKRTRSRTCRYGRPAGAIAVTISIHNAQVRTRADRTDAFSEQLHTHPWASIPCQSGSPAGQSMPAGGPLILISPSSCMQHMLAADPQWFVRVHFSINISAA